MTAYVVGRARAELAELRAFLADRLAALQAPAPACMRRRAAAQRARQGAEAPAARRVRAARVTYARQARGGRHALEGRSPERERRRPPGRAHRARRRRPAPRRRQHPAAGARGLAARRESAAGALPAGRRRGGHGRCRPRPGAGAARPRARRPTRARDFVSVVLADTEDTWSALFEQAGSRYQPPKLVLFSQVVRSACGTAQSAMGPFYCPRDQKVYIDLDFFRELRERFGAPGDFAQAYVIAHEVGHHVQNLLGISEQVQRRAAARGRGAGQRALGAAGAAGRLLRGRLGASRRPRRGSCSRRATSRKGSAPPRRSATTACSSRRRATWCRSRSRTAARSSAWSGSRAGSSRARSRAATPSALTQGRVQGRCASLRSPAGCSGLASSPASCRARSRASSPRPPRACALGSPPPRARRSSEQQPPRLAADRGRRRAHGRRLRRARRRASAEMFLLQPVGRARHADPALAGPGCAAPVRRVAGATVRVGAEGVRAALPRLRRDALRERRTGRGPARALETPARIARVATTSTAWRAPSAPASI